VRSPLLFPDASMKKWGKGVCAVTNSVTRSRPHLLGAGAENAEKSGKLFLLMGSEAKAVKKKRG